MCVFDTCCVPPRHAGAVQPVRVARAPRLSSGGAGHLKHARPGLARAAAHRQASAATREGGCLCECCRDPPGETRGRGGKDAASEVTAERGRALCVMRSALTALPPSIPSAPHPLRLPACPPAACPAPSWPSTPTPSTSYPPSSTRGCRWEGEERQGPLPPLRARPPPSPLHPTHLPIPSCNPNHPNNHANPH
jgi:hypothetical protein